MIIWHVLLLTYDSCATPRSNEVYWAGSRLFPGSSPSEWTSAELWRRNLKSIWRSCGENEGKRDYLGAGFSFRVQEVLVQIPDEPSFGGTEGLLGHFGALPRYQNPTSVFTHSLLYTFSFSHLVIFVKLLSYEERQFSSAAQRRLYMDTLCT